MLEAAIGSAVSKRVSTVTRLALVVMIAGLAEVDAKAPRPTSRLGPVARPSVMVQKGAAVATAAGRLRGKVAIAPRDQAIAGRKGGGYAALVGDPRSGYGFYALPPEIRAGAARYRLAHRRFWWQNPVLAAMAADALRNPCWIPAGQEYRCGVFNPIDGVGTPFFGGYYR
jgi:hypothetical protein